MTWIRWECDAPDHPVFSQLADRLNVHRLQSYGHYVAVCCRLGGHQPDGLVGELSDRALEAWAGWTGRKGIFASAFRETCVEQRADARDPIGCVKGWWRQRALLEKQANDALKPGQGTRKARQRPDEGPRGLLGCNGNDNDKASTKLDVQGFAEAWKAHLGGAPPYSRLVRALKPLVSQHGVAEVQARWKRYLEAHNGDQRKYLSPEGFASRFGLYGEPTEQIMTDENGVDRLHRKDESGQWVPAA